MKVIQIILTIFIAALAASPLLGGQSQSALSEALQRGLVAEEVNRDLPAAIVAYEAAVARFDQDRDLAATAIFRLAKTYRRVDRNAEAEALYQRLIREFPDQTELARLAAERLPEEQAVAPAGGGAASEFSPVTIRIQTEDGRPLEGFRVEMESGEGRRVFASGESDATGLALSRNLPYGEYELRINGPWKTTFQKITVEVGAPLVKIVYSPDPDARARVRIRSAVEQEAFAGLRFGLGNDFPGSVESPALLESLPELGNGVEQVAFQIEFYTWRSVVQPDGSTKTWHWTEDLPKYLLATDAAWIIDRELSPSVLKQPHAGRYFRVPDLWEKMRVFYRVLSLERLENSEIEVEIPAGENYVFIEELLGKADADVLTELELEKEPEVWLPTAFNERSAWQNRMAKGDEWDDSPDGLVNRLTLEPGETREIVLQASEAKEKE